MIKKEISKSIVTVGCDYRCTKGGISTVLESYSKIYSPFYFIASSTCNNLLINLLCLIKSAILLLFKCCFPKTKIIHIHTASNNSFRRKSILIRIAKFLNKKVVLHIHGGGFKDFLENNKKSVSNTISKVDVIVVLSLFWETYFKDVFPNKKIITVPNIVEEPIKNIIKIKDKECVQFIFLGLICDAKGIFDLIDTIKLHKNYLTGKFKLHIGGNGDVERLCKLIELFELQDIVLYEGWVDKEKKAELLSNSDVFILPSHTEGVPISILEAMSYGLPVISTCVGGIPEIVENNVNGYLFQPGNKEQLFDCIIKFLGGEKTNHNMSQHSLKRVTPHLPHNVAMCLEKIYEDLQ